MLAETRFFVGENRGKIFLTIADSRSTNPSVADDLLTIPEAAKRLKIGESTLRRYLRRRLLSYIVLPGNDRRIEPREIDDFKKARTVPRKDGRSEKWA